MKVKMKNAFKSLSNIKPKLSDSKDEDVQQKNREVNRRSEIKFEEMKISKLKIKIFAAQSITFAKAITFLLSFIFLFLSTYLIIRFML